MKNSIRITIATLILSFAAACANKPQPPVHATCGKDVVPVHHHH